ncbi:MAG: HAD-IA family hydrolase [Solobacterium sp.]|nr:HAD-IA family hydrolase [Solobacterium sp.]MCH4227444.1 HAD-IA family hydrolase [Solobacterium sp.]MCH4282868.1 HAD-IA family hydrolase [Solobacterium sp.]
MKNISLLKKEVFWDFDGTLFDSYPLCVQAIQKVLHSHRIDISDEHLYARMMTTMSSALKEIIKAYPDACTLDEFNQALNDIDPSSYPLYPHVREVLEYIVQQGGHNYLLTHRGHSALEAIKDKDIDHLFASYVTSESGYPRKPDPTSVLTVMKQHHASADQVIIIGDRQIETDAAKNAGVTSIWYASNSAVPVLGSDYTIHDYSELLSVQ